MREVPVLLVAFLLGAVPIVAIIIVRAVNASRWRSQLVSYDLGFSRGLDPKAVTAFFNGLAGLAAPRYLRQIVARAVVFETIATANGIRHHLLVPKHLQGIVLSQLRACLSDVTPVPDAGHAAPVPVLAGEFGQSGATHPLRTEHAEMVSAGILATLQPIRSGERLVTQWVLSPVGPSHSAPGSGFVGELLQGKATPVRSQSPDAAARAKRSSALFQVVGRLGVDAAPERARQLLRRMTAAFHAANSAEAHLYRRGAPSAWTARQIAKRSLPLVTFPLVLPVRARVDAVNVATSLVRFCVASQRPLDLPHSLLKSPGVPGEIRSNMIRRRQIQIAPHSSPS